MDTVKVIEVVETALTRRGDGVEGSPIRVITQYWDRDGNLLAERDPLPEDNTTALEIRISKLERAIRWALGEIGDFGSGKPADAKPFWWRKELRARAGL